MNTKRLQFKASTLCAGGTLLVLGGFLTLNLAGCGGGGGGVVVPTTNPSVTATPSSSAVRFQLQLSSQTNATGGTVRLTGNGRTYTATANNSGLVSINNVLPGTYEVVFNVVQGPSSTPGGGVPTPTPSTVTTTRSLTIASPTTAGPQYFTLIQGQTGDSNPYTISGRVLLNPAGTDDPDGDSATSNCGAVLNPVTAALIITVRDLNSSNGTPIIAQTTRAAQPSSTSATEKGIYSISIPYRPRSFQVTVSSATDAPFAGKSALTSFPQSNTTLANIDICTNASTTAPRPSVTATPSPTPILTPTAVGTAIATPTRTPNATATPTATVAPTSTPVATATTAPTNTPIPGSTSNPNPTTNPNAPTATPSPTPTATTQIPTN